MASAVFSGSWGSNGGGFREVFTAQKRHPRVHVSPISYMRRQWRGTSAEYVLTYHDSRGSRPFALLIGRTLSTLQQTQSLIISETAPNVKVLLGLADVTDADAVEAAFSLLDEGEGEGEQ